VEKWTSNYEPEHIMALLQREGVAAGVVQDARDICSDVHLRERECFWRGNHKELGSFSYLGQPSRLSMTPAKLYREAPILGEHNEYICLEILGMSEAEFDGFLMAGAFGQMTS
jgi:crotonobetainyl-CoA:carnitine CoA-transferase CaiB-like acyl-CoA transferase